MAPSTQPGSAATGVQIKEHNLAVTAEAVARLNDIKTVMARLRVGRSTVFELFDSGQLRSVKIGRRRLVPESALIQFIESLEHGGDAA